MSKPCARCASIGWADVDRVVAGFDLSRRALSNDAIEQVVIGPLRDGPIGCRVTVRLSSWSPLPIRELDDEGLTAAFAGRSAVSDACRDANDSLPTSSRSDATRPISSSNRSPKPGRNTAATKRLAGRIHYRGPGTDGAVQADDRQFDNMLKETIFAATQTIRTTWATTIGASVCSKTTPGVVTFDDEYHACFKVETHNHPSALEPYGGANTGIGGVIRDPMGTGLGAKPVCNTDVFCFAPPDTPADSLPPGVLHPRRVMKGVVAGVRDYGNRMGIPTVNGAVYFDPRYLGNPLVYCGNVGMIPVGMEDKAVKPDDLIVAIGGRTGRDGIHGATFSSAELTSESESLSGGAVQIGNAITEKMVLDVLMQARDRGLFNAVTDCGAGGFSSAVGEMGEHVGAEVWLEKAPLKYEGLTYTEIWISEAQERMVLAVPQESWDELRELCESEGVEAAVLGRFAPTGRLQLTYHGHVVGDISMQVPARRTPAGDS